MLERPIVTPELIEALASQVHESWSHWMKYLFSRCTINIDGTVHIPTAQVIRWMRQMTTPYAELSESEKESDRREIFPLISLMIDAVALQEDFDE